MPQNQYNGSLARAAAKNAIEDLLAHLSAEVLALMAGELRLCRILNSYSTRAVGGA